MLNYGWVVTRKLGLGPNPAAAASSVRYALIVGNDHASSPGLPLKDLDHAEREARELRDLLVELGNFDPNRVVLVIGGGRQQILDAAQRLTDLHRQDREDLGGLPTLFVFYFTGHGLSGQLLTRDDPITGSDLGELFTAMNATLSVGFFDACFAESLESGLLSGKGAVSTPGFNPFAEMPREVLRSEGKMWFVSSRPEEKSFEDERYGGLFTNYFSEAFTQAKPDGIGVRLEEMWEYARRHTEAYAAKYGQQQTPVKIVHNLKARGPLYFSFSKKRNAKVRFAKEIAGTFLFQYQVGALVEKVTKRAGEPLEVSFYAGEVILSRLDQSNEKSTPRQKLVLQADTAIEILSIAASDPVLVGLGYGRVPIVGKGDLSGLVITQRTERTTLRVEAGYGISPADTGAHSGLHRVAAGINLAYGRLSAAATLVWGSRNAQFDEWHYQLHAIGLHALVGYGLYVGNWRLDLLAGAEPKLQLVDYSNRGHVSHFGLWLGGSVRGVLPLLLSGGLALQIKAGFGILGSRAVAAEDTGFYWLPAPVLEVGLSLPFWVRL